MEDHDSDEEGGLSLGTVFTEPPRPPTPEPTMSTYSRSDGRADIKIRLIGSHPLWGHHLWNAAIAFASYLDSHMELTRGRHVLELGAGGGLPSLIAAQNGAKKVVLTDYPDAALIENIAHNVQENTPEEYRSNVSTQGYIWGQPVDNLIAVLPEDRPLWSRFDLIILSDLVFNHSQHDALLNSCERCLTPISPQESDASPIDPPPCVLVFYTHHRPHLAHRDLNFFEKARDRGWNCKEIYTKKFPPMFPEDPGDVEIRSTVHGWMMTREVKPKI